MTDARRWIEFAAKLNELTRDRKIAWMKAPPEAGMNPFFPPSFVYTAQLMGKRIRLYERPGPAQSYSLEILNDDGSVATVVPETLAIRHLYETVEAKAGAIDDFVKQVLEMS